MWLFSVFSVIGIFIFGVVASVVSFLARWLIIALIIGGVVLLVMCEGDIPTFINKVHEIKDRVFN